MPLQVARAPLTLASASPRRLALLAQIGITPDHVVAPGIDETPGKAELPRPHAERLAREKAAAAHQPGHYTLAADTVVALGRRILPKAETPDQVRTCLTLLSGRRHHVITAIVLIDPNGHRSERTVDTAVALASLPPDRIEAYAAGGEGLGKAGGYAIQGAAAAFVRLLIGSHSAVVGLPLFETAQLLRGRAYPLP